jgi:DNA helicase-2/ATP-dependent DNA helicase PcrA
MANSITSDDLIPIEQHFRVSAGPGAGKTHWLINHMKNVLHTSLRLGKTRKIACITYTNIAVLTILSRLGTSSNSVEVSTIHSFLYKHIVKPYARFIANDYGLNVAKMDGHDDVILSNYSFLDELKQATGQQRITDNSALVGAIANSRWRFNPEGNLDVKPDYPQRVGGYSIKNETYLQYKKNAWAKGFVHHDDVLFFSYQLLTKFPFILSVLRAKFPYFFIDEFQDSNPIQVRILEMIGQLETKIGIIGDKAQSIYGFQGADASQFQAFSLDNMADYKMSDNRRSTNQIIDCLNIIRSDFLQNKYNDTNGELPCILVGDMGAAFAKGKELSASDFVHTLSYKNIISNAMKKEMNSNIPSGNLFHSLSETDSNKGRQTIISDCIRATEFALHNRFKDALKELEKQFKEHKDLAKKEALRHLVLLIHKYREYSNGSLLEYHAFINTQIKQITGLRKGAILDFYTNHTYQQLAVCVNIIEDDSLHRTIHKSKGDEFDNVILILNEEKDLNFLFAPDLDGKEEHRVFYVAISRAKRRLFISVPTLTDANRVKLAQLPFVIHDLTE